MNNYVAYVLALYERTSRCQSACRWVDVFSERDPTITMRESFYIAELLSWPGQSFEEASVAALRLLKLDPRLSWALEFLAPRAQSLLAKV